MSMVKLRNTSKGERFYGDGDKVVRFGHIDALGLIGNRQPDVEVPEKVFSGLMKTPVFKSDYDKGIIERRW